MNFFLMNVVNYEELNLLSVYLAKNFADWFDKFDTHIYSSAERVEKRIN